MMLLSNYSNHTFEAGTDEAGRGCLAGPVVAAAVILPAHFEHPMLNDSKKLSEARRLVLKSFIEEHALAYSVSFVWQDEIDQINILNASIMAMHRALAQLKQQPEFIVVDGNRFKPYQGLPHQTIVKGDAKYLSIAAASILAKTERDAYMKKIHGEFSHYNWSKNKGYPTKEHREAIRQFGITKYHRKSFRLLPEQLQLNLDC